MRSRVVEARSRLKRPKLLSFIKHWKGKKPAETNANYYFEMIQRNEKWEYPLNIPSVDEIIESDRYHDEGEQDAVETHAFLLYLRDLTVVLRRGELINHIYIDDFWLLVSEDEVEVILPFWRQFTDALVDYRFVMDYHEGKEFNLTICNIELPRALLDILGDALQQTHFHVLQFVFNNIGEEGWGTSSFDFVVKCIQSNPRLNTFVWRSNNFPRSSEMDHLYTAINNNASLRTISLGDCVMYNHASLSDILRKLKSKNLEKLFLYRNGLSNFGPTDMHDFLAANPALKVLSIHSNPINDEDVRYIADALKQNTSLRLLIIMGVIPELDGLYSTIFNDSSMNAVHASNHYCYIRASVSWNPFDIFNRYQCPILNMRKKIFYLLSKRHRSWDNAYRFDSEGIGIKHLPNILALLKPYSEHGHHLPEANSIANGGREGIEVEPLSIAYEIMRSWRMPELYNLSDKIDASD